MSLFDKIRGKTEAEGSKSAQKTSTAAAQPAKQTASDEKMRAEITQQFAAVGEQVSDDLSESGAISIDQQINICMEAGNWVDAEKWTLHAMESRPDRPHFKVKLAEIYQQMGETEKYRKVVGGLLDSLPKDDDLRQKLIDLAKRDANSKS